VPLLRSRGIVCVITDRHRLLPDGTPEAQQQALVEQAVAAAAAGADVLQIRERDLTGRALYGLVRQVLVAVSDSVIQVLVNDRLDVALAAGAHGVHVPGSGLSPGAVRSIAPPRFCIGQSIHGEDQPDPAADVAIFGTVFPTRSKEAGHTWAGLEGLASAARRARVPVLAIGGISGATVADVAPLASGVAAIGWFATRDPQRMSEAVRCARAAFDTIPPVI
jgi:thiamine-phosphate pyrophosphorylase